MGIGYRAEPDSPDSRHSLTVASPSWLTENTISTSAAAYALVVRLSPAPSCTLSLSHILIHHSYYPYTFLPKCPAKACPMLFRPTESSVFVLSSISPLLTPKGSRRKETGHKNSVKLRSAECLPHTLIFGMHGKSPVAHVTKDLSHRNANARILGSNERPDAIPFSCFWICHVPPTPSRSPNTIPNYVLTSAWRFASLQKP